MKRILYVLLALIFVFALTACGNNLPATDDSDLMAAEQVDDGEVEVEESDDSSSSSSFSCDGDPITAFGGFTGYDRFSGEQVAVHIFMSMTPTAKR